MEYSHIRTNEVDMSNFPSHMHNEYEILYFLEGDADYTIEGEDYTGQKCIIHIVNVDEGEGWKPTVATDSRALAFLNGTGCRAALQGRKDKLTVRIFAKAGTSV